MTNLQASATLEAGLPQVKPRVKAAIARTPKTLAQKIPYFIGCDTSDAWPPDASQRYKEYLRSSLAKKHSR